MKVVLLKDVARIGRRFAVAEVPDGYALNMLIPKGMAEAATPENLKKIKALSANAVASAASKAEQFTAAVAELETTQLVVTAAANEQGHLFEALKPETIAAASSKIGAGISAEQIILSTPIKSIGEHEISLHEGANQKTITILVAAA